MKILTTWLLGGALAASLTWNWRLARASAAPAACAESTSCALGTDELGLEPELRTRLAELCATSCGESDRLEREANALQARLLASLSAETLDEAACARLVDEVSALRRRSLASCVEGILGVREVLTPAQVQALLARCAPGAASCR